MLDEEGVAPQDRLRLLIMFLLFKDGLVPADLQKLIAHAQLPPQNGEVIHNMELLGARTTRNIKDSRPVPSPLFPKKPPPAMMEDEYALSRYEPVLQNLLEAHATNTLDAIVFPYTKPPLDLNEGVAQQQAAASLRSAKPTWAKSRQANAGVENRQRVVVFMAGGATYSEARACYNVGRDTGRETFLVTSHMLTPHLFIRQVGDLSTDKRRLNIPAEMPKPQAPRHLFEPDEPPKPKVAPQPVPAAALAHKPQPPLPTQQMAAMGLNGKPSNGNMAPLPPPPSQAGKLTKDPDKKKKHHFGFGRSKDK
jgi:syntaxin-binding protein 1